MNDVNYYEIMKDLKKRMKPLLDDIGRQGKAKAEAIDQQISDRVKKSVTYFKRQDELAENKRILESNLSIIILMRDKGFGIAKILRFFIVRNSEADRNYLLKLLNN